MPKIIPTERTLIMMPFFMQENIIAVRTEAFFDEEGFLHPVRFTFDKSYEITEVVSSSVVKEEEYKQLFPGPPKIDYHPVYKYEVRIGKNKATLYFDRWPESGAMAVGRWFVVKR